MGSELNLENPKTLTEKLQWIKLYYHHPDMLRAVDKYEFKLYVEEKIGEGYSAPIIKVWDSPEDVLKSTLQSDGIFIISVQDVTKLDVIGTEN